LFSLSGAIRIRNWKRFVDLYLGGTEHKERINKCDEELLTRVIGEIKESSFWDLWYWGNDQKS
jgi:hypothetical protein